MIGKSIEDCVEATKRISNVLSDIGFDPADKGIVALCLLEAAKAEQQEIEELERMVHSE